MMITENILKKFKNNILVEGSTQNKQLKIPEGTKSAKIVCHVDLDGLISGITMMQLLQQKGIPKNRIRIEFAQYGDDEREGQKHTNKFISKKGEYTGVTDFAKLPKVKPFSIYNKLVNFKSDKKQFLDFINSKDFSKLSQEEFNKIVRKEFPVKDTKWTEGNLKELLTALKAYEKLGRKPEANINNIEKLEYQLVNPDFVSDHHSNEQGALSGGKTGEIAVDSPSEAEYLAKNYAHGMWNKDDIDAVSMIDSAGYTLDQLTNTVFLEKHFTGSDKKKNLATILSCIFDNMTKKDREAAKWVIRNSSPSLVSAYNNTLKAAGFNGKRLEYLNALKEGDNEKAKELLKEIPEGLSKAYTRRGEPKQPIMSHEDWQKKNNKDVKNMVSGYKNRDVENKLTEIKGKRGDEAKLIRDTAKSMKGKIQQKDNFTIFNGKNKKEQYSRYMTSLYSKNGMRSPYTMRYWDSFFQVAKNSLYKGNVDFSKVNEKVLQDVKKFLLSQGMSEFRVDPIIDNMKEKNGGHSDAIWSFQGFDKIKPTSKEMGNYWDAKRVYSKNPNAPTASRIVREKESGVIKDYKDLRDKTMGRAMNSAVYWTNQLYPVDKTKLDALKNTDERFEDKTDYDMFKPSK